MATDKKEKIRRLGPGANAMGLGGIILVVGYLLLTMGFVIWSLVALWPPIRSKEVRARIEGQMATPSPSPATSPSPTTAPAVGPAQPPPAGVSPTVTPALSSPSPSVAPSPKTAAVTEPDCETSAKIKEGFCLDEGGKLREGVGALKYFGQCWCIYDEDRLLLIVLLAGALGALVHGLRSLSWYIGNRRAVWSWSAMYFMLPFLGAGLAAIFYLVIRGGFFSPTSTVETTSPFGFAALAALVGMFTEPAVIKLRKVAITVFEPPEQGKDHVGPAPTITEISPKEGSTEGGEAVTITGDNFSSSVVVTFDGAKAKVTSATETSITVETPKHAAGLVDVIVTNEDKQISTSKQAFEYKTPPQPASESAAGAAAGAGGAAEASAAAEADGAAEAGAAAEADGAAEAGVADQE